MRSDLNAATHLRCASHITRHLSQVTYWGWNALLFGLGVPVDLRLCRLGSGSGGGGSSSSSLFDLGGRLLGFRRGRGDCSGGGGGGRGGGGGGGNG